MLGTRTGRFSCSEADWRVSRTPGDTWGAWLHLHHSLPASAATHPIPLTSYSFSYHTLLSFLLPSPLNYPTLPSSVPYFLKMSLLFLTSFTSFSISTSFTSQSSFPPTLHSSSPPFHHPLCSSSFSSFLSFLMTLPSLPFTSSALLPSFIPHLFYSPIFHPCSPSSFSSSPSSSTLLRSLHLKSPSSFLFLSRHPVQSGVSVEGVGGRLSPSTPPHDPRRPPIHLSAAPPRWGVFSFPSLPPCSLHLSLYAASALCLCSSETSLCQKLHQVAQSSAKRRDGRP